MLPCIYYKPLALNSVNLLAGFWEMEHTQQGAMSSSAGAVVEKVRD